MSSIVCLAHNNQDDNIDSESYENVFEDNIYQFCLIFGGGEGYFYNEKYNNGLDFNTSLYSGSLTICSLIPLKIQKFEGGINLMFKGFWGIHLERIWYYPYQISVFGFARSVKEL